MASPEFPQPEQLPAQHPENIYPVLDDSNPEFVRIQQEVVQELLLGKKEEGIKPMKMEEINMKGVEEAAKIRMIKKGMQGDAERRREQFRNQA